MLDRLDAALDLIERDLVLGLRVDVATVARTAATSEHHLRRTFSTLAGMPIGGYVRRRRMTLAAADLIEDAAVTSRPAPDGLDHLEVPAGAWLVLATSGPYPEAMQHLWRDAYGEWFPSNPWRTRPGPEILRAELHEDGSAEAELWLPIEPVPR